MDYRRSLAFACALSALIPGIAFAQSSTPVEPAVPATDAAGTTEAPAAAGTAASPDSGEIVVTAQRRSESLQKAALAITAFSGDTLAARGVVTAADLQTQVPGLQIAPQVFGNLQIFLRGVGSTANTAAGDPAIAFNIDGVYVARTTSTAGLLFDLDRIEVVKGPQGTLYGRNATGGAVNVITKKPTFGDLSGYETIDVGNYGSIQTEGAINVPLSDTLAARVSYKTANHDGYVKAAPGLLGTVGNDRDDQDDKAVRAEVLWKPTERLTILSSADYSKQGGAGGGEQLLPLTTSDPYVVKASQYIFRKNEFADASIQADYDLGFGKLTYIGAYRYSSVDRKYEYPLTNYAGYLIDKDRQWSHELRLGGDIGRLTYVVGLYHFNERDAGGQLRLQITPTLFQDNVDGVNTTKSDAAFGQATYKLTDRLRLTGGIRYTKDRKVALGRTLIENTAGTVLSTSSVTNSRGTFSDINWKAGAEFDVTPTSLAYFNASTAFKSGGSFGGTAPNTFNPEHLTAYEVGLKNRFFDNSVTLNLAAYLYDYNNLQVTSLDSDNGTLRTVTRNAGSATIKGLEADVVYTTPGFGRFDGSVAYTHARYDKFVLPFGDSFTNFGKTTQTSINYNGQSLPLAPAVSFNLGYQHTYPFWNGSLTGRVQTHYESGKYLDFHHFAVDYQGSYTKTDVTLTYQPANARWSLEAYVRNLENHAVRTTSIPPISANPIYAQAFYAPPRLYGARLSVKF